MNNNNNEEMKNVQGCKCNFFTYMTSSVMFFMTIMFIFLMVYNIKQFDYIESDRYCNITMIDTKETDRTLFLGYELYVVPDNVIYSEYTSYVYNSYSYMDRKSYDEDVDKYYIGYSDRCYFKYTDTDDIDGELTFVKEESIDYNDAELNLRVVISMFITFDTLMCLGCIFCFIAGDQFKVKSFHDE